MYHLQAVSQRILCHIILIKGVGLKRILVLHLLLPVNTLMSHHSIQLSEACFLKKLLISSSNASKIPIDLSLKLSPFCHTLLKALDISTKKQKTKKKHHEIQK